MVRTKKIALTLALFLLSGCYAAMNRDDVISAVKQCEDAGLEADIVRDYSSRTKMVVAVHCKVGTNR